MTCEQNKLLHEINILSFTVIELTLFLDTHPCNQEAMECYQEYKKMRQEAMEEYTRCFGPLQKDNVPENKKWMWALQPWPWKGEC